MSEASTQFRSVWATVNGLSMHARVSIAEGAPARPPVVLVAGLGLSSRVMLPTAQAFAGTHRVYAPDLPGYGLSAKPKEVFTLRQLADSLDGWMERQGLDQAIIVGNSVGCQIVVELAVRSPARAGSLALTGPSMDPPARNTFISLLRWARELPLESPMFGIMLRDYLDCGPRRFLKLAEYARQDRLEDKAPLLEMPVLVMRGSRDPLVSQEWAERIARLAPQGRLVVVPNAAHNLTFLAPESVAEVVRAWTDGLAKPRRRQRRAGQQAA